MVFNKQFCNRYDHLKDNGLLILTRTAAATEKEATLILLQFLVEVDARRAYATLAYSSLFEYVVKGLGLSESSAAERVNAVRLMRSVPDVNRHLAEGGLSVSAAAQIQRFIRNEEKANASQDQRQTRVAPETKASLVSACLGQSKREVEKTLLSKQSEAAKHINREKVRSVTPQRSEIKFTADAATVQKLDRAKELLGNLSLEKIFDLALAALVEKEEKRRGMTERDSAKDKNFGSHRQSVPAKTNESKNSGESGASREHGRLRSSSSPNSRFVPIEVKRFIFKRSAGQCEYVHSESGNRCISRYKLQIDHIEPFSLGGKTEANNLRHLCSSHNLKAAMDAGLLH